MRWPVVLIALCGVRSDGSDHTGMAVPTQQKISVIPVEEDAQVPAGEWRPVAPTREDNRPDADLGSKLSFVETAGNCWSVGTKIAEGSQAKVYQVTQEGSDPHALKFFSPSSKAYQREVHVMMAAADKQCKGIMPLVEARPCNAATNSVEETAFVMPLMKGDLWTWGTSSDITKGQVQKCGDQILQAIYDALKCLHDVGYMHGDLKADNIFYKKLDGRSCPTDLYLGDFGLAEKIGTHPAQYSFSNYRSSNHLPSAMFGQGEQRSTLGVFKAHRWLDFCSLGMLSLTSLALELSLPESALPDPLNCGWMGKDRKMPLTIKR